MKIGSVRFSTASLIVLVVQLGIVSTVAAKYLYQRWTCPRVWVQAVAYDPELVMRGRYLSTQLLVDGCGSTLPSAKSARFAHNVDGTVQGPRYQVQGVGGVSFRAKLAVGENRLVAIRLPESAKPSDGQDVAAVSGTACDYMHLTMPVNFYIAEHATSPLPMKAGEDLWMEVTVPPKGPPRPIQLARKRAGKWEPLGYE